MDHFPSTTWLWRRLCSKIARRVGLSFITLVTVTTVSLRIQSAIFARRVHSTLAGLEQLRLDQTTRAELLERVPNLRAGTGFPDARCRSDECFSVEISNVPNGLAYRLYEKTKSHWLHRVTYLLGYRFFDFSAGVGLHRGKVSEAGYRVSVDDGTDQGLGGTIISVGGTTELGVAAGNTLSDAFDQSPDYRVKNLRKWPDQVLAVNFETTAPPQSLQHAFDVRLSCMWSFAGCKTAKQIVPFVWEDLLSIPAAASSRLRGSEPCPDRILAPRVSHFPDIDILLLRVERVTADLETSQGQEPKSQVVEYRLLDVLRGSAEQRLTGVVHPTRVHLPDSREEVPNPALKLLQPGADVLMFSRKEKFLQHIDPSCQIVAAAPSALRTIRSEIAAMKTTHSDSDPPQ